VRFSELDGRAVAVWGVGRETRSFARQLAERLPAARLLAVIGDDPERDEAAAAADPSLRAAPFISGADAAARLPGLEVLVRSPGVSIHKPELVALREHGVTVTTATGLWLHERRGEHVIGITGTKGKGTTAVIAAHLSGGQRPTHLAGNIGRPVLDLLDVPAGEWVVLELSSFQVADLACGPEVAVLTNLFKEHIDWHGSEADYRREKLRLLGLPCVRACAYRPGDPEVEAAIADGARQVRFGVAEGWHLTAEGVRDSAGALIPAAALPLRGAHNAENLCAALAALDAAGFPRPPLPGALAGVRGLPHRLETILLEENGTEWVDDSIATNPAASIVALQAFDGRPVVLLAGGYERGQDLAALAEALASSEHVHLVCMPVTGARLAGEAIDAGMDRGRISYADDMAHAIAIAREHAGRGAAVLLSPAAASYNAYRDFEQRGEHFATLVGARRHGEPAGGGADV
jgi:UDP-N-acetylmuramoylalanine--D-glutamate ligase